MKFLLKIEWWLVERDSNVTPLTAIQFESSNHYATAPHNFRSIPFLTRIGTWLLFWLFNSFEKIGEIPFLLRFLVEDLIRQTVDSTSVVNFSRPIFHLLWLLVVKWVIGSLTLNFSSKRGKTLSWIGTNSPTKKIMIRRVNQYFHLKTRCSKTAAQKTNTIS